MKKFIDLIVKRGFTLMLTGMITAITGVISHIFLNTPRYAGTPLPKATVVLAIIGFSIYVIGRVAYAAQRKHTSGRQPPRSHDDD